MTLVDLGYASGQCLIKDVKQGSRTQFLSTQFSNKFLL